MQTEDNVLEIGLELAAAEPAHRPEFFRLLLESTIFILGSSEQMDEGSVTLKANTQVQIKNRVKPDGSSVIPFFSSLRALQLAIKSDEPYIALPARTFFQITRGADLILNPRSQYGKEFTPAEVEALLSEGVSQLAEQRVVEKDTGFAGTTRELSHRYGRFPKHAARQTQQCEGCISGTNARRLKGRKASLDRRDRS